LGRGAPEGLFTRVRGRGILRSSDAPFACWNFFTKVVQKVLTEQRPCPRSPPGLREETDLHRLGCGVGVGRRNRRLHCWVCTPHRKIRHRFDRYKHTSLNLLVVTFYELRFDGVLRRSLPRRRIGRLAYKGNLITLNTKITHLSDALLLSPAR